MKTNRAFFWVIVLLLSGCGMLNSEAKREPVSASTVRENQAQCERIASAHAEFWSSHDVSLFEGVYTEDIVHDDGDTYIEGAEDVTSMANQVKMFFPKLQVRLVGLYIAGDECLGVYEYFPLILGGYDFTEEDPLIEIDLLRTQDDLISYWGLFEDHGTIEKYREQEEIERIDEDLNLLKAYAAAWSSNDIDEVANLYATDATREDLMFGEQQSDTEEIRTFASSFFKQHPWGTWELQVPFSGDLSGMHVTGGTFTIQLEEKNSEPCVIEAAVLLRESGEQISRESIYHDADSLIKCGWAN